MNNSESYGQIILTKNRWQIRGGDAEQITSRENMKYKIFDDLI